MVDQRPARRREAPEEEKKEDNEESLKKKTQILEYKAFPEAIIKIFRY